MRKIKINSVTLRLTRRLFVHTQQLDCIKINKTQNFEIEHFKWELILTLMYLYAFL